MPNTSGSASPDESSPEVIEPQLKSRAFNTALHALRCAVTHVFFPVELPRPGDHSPLETDHLLTRTVRSASHAYSAYIHGAAEQARWYRVTKMLDNLQSTIQSEHLDKDRVISQLRAMQVGDILTFFVRPQNAAIILTKREDCVLYESFEVSPSGDAVEEAAGSLICSYPRSVVETPNEVFDDVDFQLEFASFLSRSGDTDSELPTPSADPKWVTALLTGIMRSVGRAVDAARITKRIRGYVSWFKLHDEWMDMPVESFDRRRQWSDYLPTTRWRRSFLWLLIKIAIQLSFDRSPLGRASYKEFMLFVLCKLARDPNNTELSGDELHLMSSKILRRLSKLGPSSPGWLSEMALNTCTRLQDILDERWKQMSIRQSKFRNPSQDELIRDAQLSLLNSREYIQSSLVDPGNKLDTPSFHPLHHRRGTLEDFLSSDPTFFEEAYSADPDITLYDVEQLVERGIDDWVACVVDVDEACVQLEVLMDRYMMAASRSRKLNPEDTSMTLLTAIELFVALDKLAVKEIPMLADYTPEIPIAFLQRLLLRNSGSFHRLSCAYQYLSARHSRSRPELSVLSNKFTADSFPVRFYDQSPHLQHLKARIEQDTVTGANALPQYAGASLAGPHDDYHEHQHLHEPQLGAFQSPLPSLPLKAKVVVFELQCPTCIRIWRSAAPRILFYFYKFLPEDAFLDPEEPDNLLGLVPELQHYFYERDGPPLYVQIHFICFYPGGSRSELGNPSEPTLRYAVQHPGKYDRSHLNLSGWWPMKFYDDKKPFYHLEYQLERHNDCLSCRELGKYVLSTSHTPNDVLSAQADCPADLSLDEFIAFAHLRSGGSLQWVNILQGLYRRVLNLRRHQVYFLLAQAVLQVGPLDLNTGAWIWHQELQDSSFCDAILDELNSLFVDVGACSFDGLMMSTISLLLTQLVARSPSEGVSERAIELLCNVRRMAFNWVQELSYDLMKAPVNEERRDLLQNMAATCRSTFDVGPAILRRIFHSMEDVSILVSCASLIRALRLGFTHDEHLRLLLKRDHRLSVVVEEILRDVILADASDHGVDLAVSKIFAIHRPGARKWEPLQYPNTRWLTCRAEATTNQPSRTVHLNLLDGMIRVEGQPLGGLPYEIVGYPERKEIFHDQGFFLIPSNLPGMDFTTIAVSSKHKVHFSLRGDHPVIRAQCNQTGDTLELIPSKVLSEDLPPALINDHVHWLNLSSKVIEVRPISLLWEQSPENWKIDCSSERYRMYKGRETLVDVRSPTWEMVSKCFECLNGAGYKRRSENAEPSNLLITIASMNTCQSAQISRLSITFPRYSLSFYVNDRGELESRDFKDMVYDENQCVGTLFGLENLLVLRQGTHMPEEFIFRRVLIPNGSIGIRNNHPVQINISAIRSDGPLYHTYDVDTEIGCLTGNGSLASVEHLAHLHAMTSYHRPDPLTGKTGVQAALCFLQSSGCRSFMKPKASGDARHHGAFHHLTQYPESVATYAETQGRYQNHTYIHRDVFASKKRTSWRAAYLFPWHAIESSSPEDCGDLDCSNPEESSLELEEIVSTVASAIRRWPIEELVMTIILAWVKLWSQSTPDDLELVQTLITTVHGILGSVGGTRLRFPLLFLLPVMAYCSPSHQAAFLSMLITFANHAQSNLGGVSIHTDCKISDGYRPTEWEVHGHIIRCLGFKKPCSGRDSEKHGIFAVVRQLLEDWPSDNTPFVNSLDSCCWTFPGGRSLTASLQPLLSSYRCNFNLKEQLIRFLAEPGLHTFLRLDSHLQHTPSERTPLRITLDHLFSTRLAPKLPARTTFLYNNHKDSKASSDDSDIPALDQLFSSLRADRTFQREYLARLDTSAQRVREESQVLIREAGDGLIEELKKHYAECRLRYMDGLAGLRESLGPTADSHEQVLERFNQWPPITADVLLRYLASTSPVNLCTPWKKCLVSLALLLTDLQRARRMLQFALDGLEEEFLKELENEGCDGWDAEEQPDWLLIQIQGNFLIRRAQAETAMRLISPQSRGNTVIQLNMGEGKSSVIIPIAAAALADGNQLVRIVVPKALMAQMFELLVGRLGWLAGRAIYHLPFSRNSVTESNVSKTKDSQVRYLHWFMSQCMTERGVLLVQPEHVISLKLMSVEQQIGKGKLLTDPVSKLQKSIHKHILTAGLSFESLPKDSFVGNIFRWLRQSPALSESSRKNAARVDRHDEHGDDASEWLNLQKWIHSHVRDLLDESDEILHTRFQLMYTIGSQQSMDGYPDRWTITQRVLRLVKERAHTLARNYPDSVEYECGPPGSFPHIRIVQASNVGQYLTSLIVEDVMAGRLPDFDFRHISPELQDAIRSFISDEDVLQVPETPKKVEEYAKHSDEGYHWSGLLLLRGLLASNILLFALAERRWRVDYGLRVAKEPPFPGHSRTLVTLAVPYRAKDMPAPNTQFGHPDISIILTCLSYYYSGLTEEQLRISFETLLNQDDSSTEYALWTEEYDRGSVPNTLQKLGEINLKSSEQWEKVIYPLFSRNKAAIDLYLARVVFPKEAKEFPWKLSGSSWDLAEKRERPITGFSGTHDCRWLLPMSIAQCDLDHQLGTDARVLAYLLKPENNFYMVTRERRTTAEFLEMVTAQEPRIRILLDVGAQVLDLTNRQVAHAWLAITPDVAGAIYFNENDELMVLTKNGITLPMSSSPLSHQLRRCVVYLDHAHTRGTDIKFPIGSRAAVTLGPKVTKDRLVQGCMRMRKLGHGHSIMFFTPLEVDQSIRALAAKKDPNTQITNADVLCWAIHETWTDIQQRAPHWAQQGMTHKSRFDALSRFCNDEITPEQLSDAWLQPECKSLADLYAPNEIRSVLGPLSSLDPGIRQRCKDLGVLSLPRAQMEEEQEREVNRERERERDVELPPKARPGKHFLHQDVVAFVRTGVVPPLHSGSAFRPIFTTLERSSAVSRETEVWSPSILATADFCKTIQPGSTRGTLDQYLRPVQWILSSKKDCGQSLVLLSSFEAERLMPVIRTSKHVHLHVYAPRTSQRMKPSDDLKLYSIPPLPSDWCPPWALIDQLNVFAGQLYLRDYAAYLRLCQFLGVPTKEAPNDVVVRRNVFHIPGSFEQDRITFLDSPLPFVKALLVIRNRGLPFARTHMGKIFQGKELTKKDF